MSHPPLGKRNNVTPNPTDGQKTGEVVDKVNAITDVLGDLRRAEYVGVGRGKNNETMQIHYKKKDVDKNGKPTTKDVYINWIKRNVGGKGVN